MTIVNKLNFLLILVLLSVIGQIQCTIPNFDTSIDIIVTAKAGETIELPCKVNNLRSNYVKKSSCCLNCYNIEYIATGVMD